MPLKSPAQTRLMQATTHGWHKPGGGGPSVKVAKEFIAAGKDYMEGGIVNKGYMGKTENFAEGGEVLGRSRDFLKEPDRFRGKPNPPKVKTDDDFSDKTKEPKGKDKSLKAITPED